MTLEELRRTVPNHARKMITQNIVDVFNKLESEEGKEFAEHYKQNFITMNGILKTGAYTINDYKNAVMFISYKLLDNSDIDAYMMTFPDRYNRLIKKYEDEGDEAYIRGKYISSFVNAYKKNDLVVKMTEQSLVPARILNAPMFQQALNIQLELAMTSRSDMVRTTAANSILTHLKQPETTQIELNVGVKGTDEIQALQNEMRRLASQQRESIDVGSNTSTEIASSKLITEIIDVKDEDIVEDRK